jgi:predicted metal-dependent phosphoesterase TrpH
VYIPHPFDRLRHALRAPVLERIVDDGNVDAIEVWNAKVRAPGANGQAADFAAEHGLAAGAGSDAHEPSAVGAAYVEMGEFTDSASFLASLRHGAICGHHYDVARTWRPRVIPSTSR